MGKLANTLRRAALAALLCLLVASCGGSEAKFTKHFEKGKEYYAAEQYKEAAIEFKNAVQVKPDDPQALYHLGLAYLRVGGPAYISSAFKAFLKASEIDPDFLDAQARIGELYFMSRDLDKAEGQAKGVLDKDKDHLDASILLASVHAARGRTNAAKKVLYSAARAHPDATAPLLALSGVHLAANEGAEAKDVLRRAIEKEPTAVEPRLALSRIYLVEKKPQAAEEELEAALKATPESIQALSALATLYMLTNRAPLAEQTAEKIITVSGGKPDGFVMLAGIHRAAGDKEKAREALKRGIDRSTDPAVLRKLLATDYLDDRLPKEASEVLAGLPGEDGKDPEARFLKARLLLLERKPKDALPDLKAYAEINPRLPFAQYYYGLASMMTGNFQAARAALNEAVSLAPGYDDARFMLAVAYLETGEVRLASSEARRLAARNPAYPGLGYLLGDVSLRQGRHDDAARFFEAVARDNPQDARAFAKLAAAYRMAGDKARALKAAERSLELHADAEVLALAVSIDLASRNFTRAKARIEEQISREPDRAVLLVLLGKAMTASGDISGAEQAYKKAIEKDHNLFSAYVELGNLYAKRGDYKEALAQYRESVRANPRALSTYILIGMLSERVGDRDGAVESYKKALEIDPKFGPAANNLAWLYSEKGGNIDVALTLAETAKERLPDEPAVSDTLGWIYYKKGAYLKAITHLRDSAAKLPNEPTVRYHLGMAYYKKGDKAEARAELRRALQLKSDFEGAQEAREALAALK